MHGHRDHLLLSTSGAGDLLEVHPSTVKRWSDQGILQVTRTRGGHRRFHLRDILAGAQDQGIVTSLDPFHPWEANVWLALRTSREEGNFSGLISLALSWLRQGDTDLLGRLFFEVGRRAEIPFPRFLDLGVRGFMARVGEEWQEGRLQVGEEHMATEVIRESLIRLRLARESSSRPDLRAAGSPRVAVVGSAEGDQHDLGAQAVRAVLERDGWRVYFLGPNVPVEDFARIQQAQVADLVCISFHPASTLPDLQRALDTLSRNYAERTPYALALGGAFQGIQAAELSGEKFHDLTLSASAQEFQAWLKTRFPDNSTSSARRIA